MHRPTRARFGPLLGLVLSVAAGCANATGPETDIEGQRLYEQYCARCHGSDGGGVKGADQKEPMSPERLALARPLNDAGRMKRVSDETIMGVIRAGRPPGMPGFSQEFTEAKMMVIAAYVRTLSGTQGSKAQTKE